MFSERFFSLQLYTLEFLGIVTCILLLIFPVSTLAQYSGGSGTENDPYQISNPADLDNVRNNLNAYFIQTADIELNVSPYNTNLGWEPIGNNSDPFSGKYDGQNYSIDSLFISRGNTNLIGLFGETTFSSEIMNLSLNGVNVTGNESTGGLVGLNRSTIKNCTVTGSVTGNDLYTGGITGENESFILKSFADVSVTGTSYVGGITGIIPTDNGDIERSYSEGEIVGEYWLGGIAGGNYGEIIDSFTLANITGEAYVAGISGGNFYKIIRSFAAGSITSFNVEPSGIADYDDGDATVTDSFWDINTTGVLSKSRGGTPLTTEEMKDSTNFTNFDFSSIWDIDDGYPFLRGVGEAGSVAVSNEDLAELPREISLKQNYPNPFNPTTVIEFELTQNQQVDLEVFDMMGKKVRTLLHGELKSAGQHAVSFAARDLASGVYIYRLKAGTKIFTRKLTLIK